MLMHIAPLIGSTVLEPEDGGSCIRLHALTVWDHHRRAVGIEDFHGVILVTYSLLIKAALNPIIRFGFSAF